MSLQLRQPSQLHIGWLLCLLLALLCAHCAPSYYQGRLSLDTLDPNKRPCLVSQECNNLAFIGRCINQVCQSSARSTCETTGDERTCFVALQQGLCAQGTQRCRPQPFTTQVWGDCLLQQSASKPCQNSICQNGDVRECFSADRGCRIDNKGRFLCFSPCKPGAQLCQGNKWGKCLGDQGPTQELCNGQDDDCDGKIDATADGEVLSKPCYSGPTHTSVQGACHFGISICDDRKWSTCIGERSPQEEECNQRDDNCNGIVDDKACPPGFLCSGNRCAKDTHPEGVHDSVGPGDSGNQDTAPYPDIQIMDSAPTDHGPNQDTANQDHSTLQDHGPPQDHSIPQDNTQAEPSVDAGPPDSIPEAQPEPRECIPGDTRPCYDGPAGAPTTPCRKGKQTCTSSGNWGKCTGQIAPNPELCDGIDNDCDGRIDRTPSNGLLTRKCYSGPTSTKGKGLCREGVQICENVAWGRCLGEMTPTPEICNERDDDCNGQIDDVAKCN